VNSCPLKGPFFSKLRCSELASARASIWRPVKFEAHSFMEQICFIFLRVYPLLINDLGNKPQQMTVCLYAVPVGIVVMQLWDVGIHYDNHVD
jgi:hypothetical protein